MKQPHHPAIRQLLRNNPDGMTQSQIMQSLPDVSRDAVLRAAAWKTCQTHISIAGSIQCADNGNQSGAWSFRLRTARILLTDSNPKLVGWTIRIIEIAQAFSQAHNLERKWHPSTK